MTRIEGGEPQDKKIQLNDSDMAQVKALLDQGVGQQSLTDNALRGFKQYLSQRNTKAQRWRQWKEAVDYMLTSSDPQIVAQVKAAKAAMRQKFLTAGDMHTDRLIAEMAVRYANEDLIGEQLCPPIMVPNRSNKFAVYSRRDIAAIPKDDVSDYGGPNMLTLSTSTDSYACSGYGYSLPVAATTVANQDAPYDVLMDATEAILETESLKREIRIKNVVGVAGSYGTNTSAIAAGEKWDSSTGGDPIGKMLAADASLWRGRGPSEKVMFSSLDVAHVLMKHPAILALFQYNGSSPGLATPDMIARFLNADRYLVGAARYDSAKEGQASASFARVWPDVWGLIRVSTRPSLMMAAFAVTFRWNLAGVPGVSPADGWVTQQWFEPNQGTAGVYYAKATVEEAHKVVAVDTGYLYTAPLT